MKRRGILIDTDSPDHLWFRAGKDIAVVGYSRTGANWVFPGKASVLVSYGDNGDFTFEFYGHTKDETKTVTLDICEVAYMMKALEEFKRANPGTFTKYRRVLYGSKKK